MPYRRKKYHQGITTEKKKYRTKRRTKDIDQILAEDLIPGQKDKLENQPVDLDLPGAGQFYCVHCAKHFIKSEALEEHSRGKPHKKRLRELKKIPYTIEESEKAAGFGNYEKTRKISPITLEDCEPPKKRVKIETMEIVN